MDGCNEGGGDGRMERWIERKEEERIGRRESGRMNGYLIRESGRKFYIASHPPRKSLQTGRRIHLYHLCSLPRHAWRGKQTQPSVSDDCGRD